MSEPSASGTPVDVKPRSRDVTDGMQKAPSRAMLRAVGMGDEDMVKPQIGVASSWNEITPCNLSLDRLAKRAKDGEVMTDDERRKLVSTEQSLGMDTDAKIPSNISGLETFSLSDHDDEDVVHGAGLDADNLFNLPNNDDDEDEDDDGHRR